MAFKNKELSVIAYANGWTMWQYRTDDSIDLIEQDLNYFSAPAKLMATGDVIYITSGSITYMRQVLNIHNTTVQIGRVN